MDIKQLSKRADKLQKTNDADHLKINKLRQYDRHHNLELQGVPMTENEDVMQITLDLIKQLDVDIEEEDISIAYRLPQKRSLGRTRANKVTNHPNSTMCNLDKVKSLNQSPDFRSKLANRLIIKVST